MLKEVARANAAIASVVEPSFNFGSVEYGGWRVNYSAGTRRNGKSLSDQTSRNFNPYSDNASYRKRGQLNLLRRTGIQSHRESLA
jgi:hypothetical protein